MSAPRTRKCEPRCVCRSAVDWLDANNHTFAPLTGQDWPALKAIAHCWDLYARSREPAALDAIRSLLSCMQPKVWPLARELAAWAMDWDDRAALWPRVAPVAPARPGGES